ncbi:hypothetical protein [Ignatzschineria cameli]|uniref:Uncharacterized protein n=1 Tax=Ignatzschineria cameli TaxID=2182793 RepID=A0A2U2AT69_9GAMM|nr:hypothetical protein [Ignatzschineria cameli]PWD87876.1 hypothetical protein DC077_00930 [Ignatzschineria cameli]PWD90444.1 hypothetical protein DC079_04720 [Ignatzschineria cameli]PWD92328.1 hypothetical protein DC081_04430 [Ignatzschineria cameli]PWD93121.1 hypothetical protein DC078_04720 [Ignatzschineria cameli]
MSIFPNLLLLNKNELKDIFQKIISKNVFLKKDLDILLSEYPFINRSLESYVISISFTLVNLELAISNPFKEKLKKNLEFLRKKFGIDERDVIALDNKIDLILELNWNI